MANATRDEDKIWCSHCCRKTPIRHEGIAGTVKSCDCCGKILADATGTAEEDFLYGSNKRIRSALQDLLYDSNKRTRQVLQELLCDSSKRTRQALQDIISDSNKRSSRIKEQ